MVNRRKDFMPLFEDAIKEGNLEIYEEKDNTIGYFDLDNEYERIYYFNDRVSSIKKRILMDDDCASLLNKDGMAKFLHEYLDPVSLMVLEKIVFIFDRDPEELDSPVRDVLYEEYGDEYAKYCCDEGMLGLTWVEKQIILINVSNILRASKETAEDPYNGFCTSDYVKIFREALLQTIYHESRHLFYECNEIVPRGEDTPYPIDGGLEENVEEYGNHMASVFYSTLVHCDAISFACKYDLKQLSEKLIDREDYELD